MNLYTSVYWTKRVIIVLSILIFVCSGFKIFQFISNKATKKVTIKPDPVAEVGFGLIDRLTIVPSFSTPPNFQPREFRNKTLNGNFDVTGGYPLETERVPLANVYKIQKKQIGLSTTEEPKKVANAIGISSDPLPSSSTTNQIWKEGTKSLEIDGQYMLIKYSNSILKTRAQSGDLFNTDAADSAGLGSLFQSILKDFSITTDLKNYLYTLDYLTYDRVKDDFFIADSSTNAKFVRINAIRQYPNLSKQDKNAKTEAIYPNYPKSNNSIVLPVMLPRSSKYADYVASLEFYNWPIDQIVSSQNSSIQTYNIKSAKKAFEELSSTNKTLISVTQKNENKANTAVSPSELNGVDVVEILKIELKMYEDVVYTTYIQPVYVFTGEVRKDDGRKLELIYIVPTVLNIIQ